MAVRDLLWGCPLCRTPAAFRGGWRGEACTSCGATFRRGAGATIVARRGAETLVRPAGEWVRLLGQPATPAPDASGRVLGPDRVRVKTTNGQRPFYYGSGFMGWVETYGSATRGTLELRADGLHFLATSGESVHWAFGTLTGIQPASSSLQLGFRDHMTAVKFLEGSVRLWTRALSDLLHAHYAGLGLRVTQLQPHVRTCPAVPADS
jgi:hypothetical protein